MVIPCRLSTVLQFIWTAHAPIVSCAFHILIMVVWKDLNTTLLPSIFFFSKSAGEDCWTPSVFASQREVLVTGITFPHGPQDLVRPWELQYPGSFWENDDSRNQDSSIFTGWSINVGLLTLASYLLNITRKSFLNLDCQKNAIKV